MRKRALSTHLLLGCLVVACTGDPTRPTDRLNRLPHLSVGDECYRVGNGDVSGPCWITVHDVFENGTGMDDPVSSIQYEHTSLIRATEGNISLWLTYEFRYAAAGGPPSFRLAKAVQYIPRERLVWNENTGVYTREPLPTTIPSGQFTLTHNREGGQSMFVGYYGACASESVAACVANGEALVRATSSMHDEVYWCGGTPPDECPVPGIVGLNRLPTAAFTGPSSNLSSNQPCIRAGFDASGSRDSIDNDPLTKSWTIIGPNVSVTYPTADSAVAMFCATGAYNVRLRVDDGRGGIDVRSQRINVSIDPPPPPPALVAYLTGPTEVPKRSYCPWNGYGTGGVAPYSYQWYKNDVLTDATYGNQVYAGTSSFTLKVKITSSDGQVAWATMPILVGYANEEQSGCHIPPW